MSDKQNIPDNMKGSFNMPTYHKISYNKHSLHYFQDKNYLWIVAHEWLPFLHYKDTQKTIQKIPKQFKAKYSQPINHETLQRTEKRNILTTIRHDKFLKMVKWNNKVAAQEFKQWILEEIPKLLNTTNSDNPTKEETPRLIDNLTGKQTKDMFTYKYGKQLTLYFAEREEWLQDIDATPSEDATNWLPGQSIKTTTKKDRNLILEVIKMGYLSPEQFIYIEYYPIIPVQHIYSYKADGTLEKFTQVNELINKEATKTKIIHKQRQHKKPLDNPK